MTRLGSVLCALAVAFVDAGCRVDDVDYEGKLCSAESPCPGDYTCKVGSCCTPTFSVTNFKVDWKTPNTVRLSWTPPANAKADFVKYVVVIGKSESELRELEQQALADQDDASGGGIRSADDHAELGQYELRQSDGFDVVDATSIDVLEPATEYRVRLLSFDSTNCASATQTLVVRTDQESFSYVLFDDAHPGGAPRPGDAATFANEAGMAFEGDTYLFWPGPNAEGAYENIGVSELGASMNADFPALDFTTAFLEAAVAIEGNPLANWGETRLLLGPEGGGCASIEAFTLSPYAFSSGPDYRVIQVPLSQLASLEGILTPEALSTRAVCEVSVGQSFALDQGVRMDAIRLGW